MHDGLMSLEKSKIFHDFFFFIFWSLKQLLLDWIIETMSLAQKCIYQRRPLSVCLIPRMTLHIISEKFIDHHYRATTKLWNYAGIPKMHNRNGKWNGKQNGKWKFAPSNNIRDTNLWYIYLVQNLTKMNIYCSINGMCWHFYSKIIIQFILYCWQCSVLLATFSSIKFDQRKIVGKSRYLRCQVTLLYIK